MQTVTWFDRHAADVVLLLCGAGMLGATYILFRLLAAGWAL